MKKILFAFIVFFGIGITSNTNAQLLKKLKDKVKQKVDTRIDNKTDKAIDKTLDKADGTDKKSSDVNVNNDNKNNGVADNDHNVTKRYVKYDFVPGNKIIYAEDFSQDVIGEFPLNWNTNGNSEIISLEGLPGKWLELKKNTKYVSGLKTKLPENFTIEYDMLADFEQSKGIPPYISFIVFSSKVSGTNSAMMENLPGMELMVRLNNGAAPEADETVLNSRDHERQRFFSGEYIKNNVFSGVNKKNSHVHVALWIQKQRLRVWLNEKKVYDLPQAIATDVDLNQMRFDITGQDNVNGFQYYVSNFKVWDKLNVYTQDGNLRIDNNLVENSIRPVAIGRKNYLFAGNHEAAVRSAMLYSLFATCKLHNVNPVEWLTYVFENNQRP